MLLISDANILIDFECCGLLAELFQLDHDIAVPDLLYEQELREQHPDLPKHGLQVLEMNGALIARAARLNLRYPAPSMNDLFTLALAQDRHCPLLSGDKQLRIAAEQEGVKVHGTLWLAELMLERGCTSPAKMREAFDTMKTSGRRLP
ncbi:MAG: PIN domain-containing protein [Gammaproteobacteria bacterium]